MIAINPLHKPHAFDRMTGYERSARVADGELFTGNQNSNRSLCSGFKCWLITISASSSDRAKIS